jgi:hypothetical protein
MLVRAGERAGLKLASVKDIARVGERMGFGSPADLKDARSRGERAGFELAEDGLEARRRLRA